MSTLVDSRSTRFSIGFSDGTYNELPYARDVAALFKTNHRERTASPISATCSSG
jgi:asparagine synthetase B (glutamine-hydrolysing)